MTTPFIVTPGQLSLSQLRQLWQNDQAIALDKAAYPAIAASAKTVADVLAKGKTVYGINTGFGLLANTKIAPDQLELLQRSIVLSHAAGYGDLMADQTVRLMMILKVNSLSRGYSGIRPEIIDAMIAMINQGVYPCIPA
ncbi:MAG: aromatic amino acid lyase, partial [Alkalimonas sp.]|nr:aromatic amino acid lyase [Alkalimonas sp.]